jgi:hypothetical protein
MEELVLISMSEPEQPNESADDDDDDDAYDDTVYTTILIPTDCKVYLISRIINLDRLCLGKVISILTRKRLHKYFSVYLKSLNC